MRAQILIFIVLTLAIWSCSKNDSGGYMNRGVITGYDVRDCICCGGLMINFSNDTIPYSGEFYQIDSLPGNSGIDEGTTFPVYVNVDWKPDSICGGNRYIKVTRMEIIKNP
jgi:hypothetical protein